MNNLVVSKGNHTKRAGFSAFLFPNYTFTIRFSLPAKKGIAHTGEM